VPALEMSGVTKRYPSGDDEIVALAEAHLTVQADEIVVLLGPSGSGKTTLLSIAGGLLAPSAGTVLVDGDDVTSLEGRDLARFRRERIGFVFQSVNLVPFLTARENLLVVRELGGRRATRGDGTDARDRADTLLGELGLSHRAGNLPTELSGGERQRVAIGRALMNEPSLVLVDEPTSSLDTELGRQVMELIRTEVKERGVAAIVVTHDERVLDFADRSLEITDGELRRA